jgi:hypothetical protein
MVAQIKIGVDNQTGEGFRRINDDLQQLGQQTEATAKEASDLRKELESRAADAYKQRIKELANQFDETKKEAGTLIDRINKLNESKTAQKITAWGSATTGVVEGFRAIAEVATVVREKIREMADAGNTDFIRLNDSIDGTSGRFGEFVDKLSQTQAVSGGLEFVSGWIDEIGKGVDALPDLWTDAKILTEEAIHGINETLDGHDELRETIHNKEMNRLREENNARQQNWENEQNRRKGLEQEKRQQDILAEVEKFRSEQRQNDAIKNMKTAGDVFDARKRELSQIEELRKAGNLTEEEAEKRTRNLIKLENRLTEIKRQNAEEIRQRDAKIVQENEDRLKRWHEDERKRLEEVQNAQRKAAEEQKRMNDEVVKQRLDAYAKEQEKEREMMQQKIEAYKQHVERLKGVFSEKGEGGEKSVAEQILFGQGDAATLQKVAENRMKQAKETFLKERAKLKAELQKDQGADFDATGFDRGTQRGVRTAEGNARRKTFNDARQGKIEDSETLNAQKQLAGETIKNARQQGTINQTEANALAKAASEIAAMSEQQIADRERLERIEKMLDDTGRKRRQRAGNGTL